MTKSIIQRAVSCMAVGAAMMLQTGLSFGDVEVELQERQNIIAEVKRRIGDQDAYKKSMAAGLERSTLCGTCHGPDGNAKKPEYPNLAEQNPAYIIEQMAKFKDGRRKSFVMEALVKSFTMEDNINSQQLKPVAEANPQLATRGERKFKEVCAMCHGENGRGEKGYARLAGQQIDYVKMNLKRFRSNALSASDFDEKKRTNARMEQVTQFLEDEDIEALAHYIALMK